MPAINCKFTPCDREARARGLCAGHYEQARTGRPPMPLVKYKRSQDRCEFAPCHREAQIRGLCKRHDEQRRQGKALMPIKDYKRLVTCSVDGCNHEHSARGLCKGHYQQQKAGRPLKPLAKRKSNGLPMITEDGYETIWDGSKRRLMHRVVMEEALGRELVRSEHVHHINGDRLDNRLENLQLRTISTHGNGVVLRCRCCGSQDVESVPIG